MNCFQLCLYGQSQAQRFSNAMFYFRHLVGRGTQITHAFVETSYHARFVVTLDERQKYEIPRNIVAHEMDFYH